MELNLSPRLSQKIKLSLQMRQALQVLQMPQLELKTFLQQELSANPFLEETEMSREEIFIDRRMTEETFSVSRQDLGEEDEDSTKQPFLKQEVSLMDHLLAQWNLLPLPDEQSRLGQKIIESLDSNGYFLSPLTEIARDCDTQILEVEKVLSRVQKLDPPGVACRNLSECLHLQICRMNRSDDPLVNFADKIVETHLRDLQEKKYRLIAQNLKTDLSTIQAAVRLIRTLNPKPGAAFGQSNPSYVIPEVVFRRKRGGYEIIYNKQDLPNFKMHSSYKKLLRDPHVTLEVREYLKNKLNSALSLIKALEKREHTIERVAKHLAREQADFLAKGAPYLKPLSMAYLARRLGLHKSTVSRAVAHKYAQTPHGVVALKAFFDNAVGENIKPISSTAIQSKIEILIKKESMCRPLSDKHLMQLLKSQAIDVSRRTIAKYRQKLRIPCSYAR